MTTAPAPGPDSRPPWWPANEAWPPAGKHAWRLRRRSFARRAAVALALLLALAGIGVVTVASWLLGGTAGASPSVVVPLLLLVLLFVVAIVMRTRTRLWHPAGGLVEAAERVAEGDYSMRVPERGPPFLRTVARAFNDMTSRLAHHDEQRRHLMADVTHELRTPLSVVQGRLEGLIDGVYPADRAHLAETLEAVRLVSRLVEDLRVLAESESPTLSLRREPTNLALLVEDVLSTLQSEAQERGVDMVGAHRDGVVADVNPLRIRQVLVNLVSNAVRHTPRGSRVTVSVERRGAAAILTVRDTGMGIGPEELPRIFDRFYKGEGSGGSGLGLTIARNLVLAHGGEISGEGATGTGTTITVCLPLQRA